MLSSSSQPWLDQILELMHIDMEFECISSCKTQTEYDMALPISFYIPGIPGKSFFHVKDGFSSKSVPFQMARGEPTDVFVTIHHKSPEKLSGDLLHLHLID